MRKNYRFIIAFAILAAVGGALYSYAGGYTYLSPKHLNDIFLAKFWSMLIVLVAGVTVYLRREKPTTPLLLVFFVSLYFVILYGILFSATEYGMNAHWGDNGNRLAAVCKMMVFNTINTDWYLKDMPAFYPPGWFALMAVYAKVIGIEAYQTVKWGYLMIFLVYPWLLYGLWRKIASQWASAVVVLLTIFFAYREMDWLFYENITAGLFIPWWLYYFEEGAPRIHGFRDNWQFYLWGSVIGGALFLIYYYWFAFAVLALPFTFIVRYYETRSWSEVRDMFVSKLILGLGIVILTSYYWFPLLRRIYWWGSESAQHQWFSRHNADLSSQWGHVSIELLMIYAGVFFAFYLWRHWERGRIPLLFLGGILVIMLDRLYNLTSTSIQSRKVIELAHVFAMAPLGIGLATMWPRFSSNEKLLRGVLGMILLGSLVVCNAQTEIYHAEYYKRAIDTRVPERDLEVFRSVDYRGKVFLTNSYREACYLPYYLFIPYYNMTSHTAGRYSQRELFLRQAAKIVEAELLAYVLKHNRYSSVDYVYLPLNDSTGQLEQTLYQAGFNDNMGEFKTFSYRAKVLSVPDIFVKRNDKFMFDLKTAVRNRAMDERVKELYPDIYWHLEPREWH